MLAITLQELLYTCTTRTGPILTTNGLRQGGSFRHIANQHLYRSGFKEMETILSLRFADDQVVLAQEAFIMEFILRRR